jgi:signal peptidase I
MDVARSGTAGPGADQDLPVPAEPTPRPGSRTAPHRPWGREVLVLVGVALLLTLLIRLLVVQAFYIPSASMQPTLQVGDRVLVSKLSYRFGEIRRGDVIVFDGRGSFAPAEGAVAQGVLPRLAASAGTYLGVSPSERDYVKRVVGLPGDRVVCCADGGALTVNGTAVDEPYVMPGDAPSDVPFDVVVPPGRLWVMGDNRDDSADSRAHLGDPGGGTVPVDRVVGEVLTRFWPLPDAGPLRAGGGGS